MSSYNAGGVMKEWAVLQMVQNSDLQMCSLNKARKYKQNSLEIDSECMQQFSREIKNSRLFCKLQPQRLQISLIDLDQDQLYQIQLQNHTLPQSATPLVSTIQELYDFIENKVRYIKISAPGKLICYKYTGTNQKYIILELERKTLTWNGQTMRYIGFLKQQLKKIRNVEKQNLKLIKGQRNTIEILQADIEKTGQLGVRKSRRSKTSMTATQPRQLHAQEEKIQMDYLGVKHQFEVSKSCSFYNKFQIDGNQVQKIVSTDSYQLYSTQPLKKHKSYFAFLITKLKYNNLIAGIITDDLLTNKDSSYCSGCVCFDNYYGVVMDNSMQIPAYHKKLKDGQVLIVVVDMQQRRVEWRNRQQLLAYADLPPKMLACKLYPYFQLFDRDDCIVLNHEV